MKPNDEELMKLVVEEAKRRGYKINATCHFCGEVFVKQELDYVIKHRWGCKGDK